VSLRGTYLIGVRPSKILVIYKKLIIHKITKIFEGLTPFFLLVVDFRDRFIYKGLSFHILNE